MAVSHWTRATRQPLSTDAPHGATSGHRPAFEPYIPSDTIIRELTSLPLVVGTLLGVDLRRVVAVPGAEGRPDGQRVDSGRRHLDHAVPRSSRSSGGRDATILENNIVQTAGSAGESIAFGLGVTMPAIMILGFDLEIDARRCSSRCSAGCSAS